MYPRYAQAWFDGGLASAQAEGTDQRDPNYIDHSKVRCSRYLDGAPWLRGAASISALR
jgi:hypothetical protein